MPGTAAALDNEWSVLLAACSVVSPAEKANSLCSLLRQSIRWKYLFDLADQHGTLPLLHQPLSAYVDAVPAGEMTALTQAFQTNLHKSLLLSRELIRIVDRLSASGIEVIPYKGPALAEAAYGDIALRQSGDIDLLIRPHDLLRVREAVGELGYTPHLHFSEAEEREYLRSGYEYAFDGAAGPNLLEVQWAIQPRFYAVDFDMAGLFDRARTATVAGQPMKALAPEDLFLILSLHAAKHVWGKLVWLCDIAQIMKMPTLDWNRISSLAKSLGIARILQVTMLAANALLGATIPVETHLADDPEARPLAQKIRDYIVSGRTCNVESLSYFRLMIQLRERPSDRLRFLRRLAFTPGPGEWNAVRLPAALFPLYRVIRLTRLAARLIRA